ncbi:hypothetical protein SBOR_6726 [Sclerotinia borealis F-4128]|uniref:Uncharacterized protein n=1 Tax=Sclerotinia borealis (strain F-4128) TaxID=1432307 RepID=W9CAR7_SCLBF|nr:hypothetical protein SBOR_6726 [Sclerotinia borealis F-4128]
MLTRRIICGATSVSQCVILAPRGTPRRDTLACVSMRLRWYHDDRVGHDNGRSKSKGEISARGKGVMGEMGKGGEVEGVNGVKAGKEVQACAMNGGNGKPVMVAEGGEKMEKVEKKRKTMAEMDEELKAKMEGREGAAGISYEGGKPVTDGFGRGVRSNMFRVI